MTSSRMGSAGTPGLEVTWQSGQEEGQRPRLWHSIRTPAAMRLVPDSDRLAMYSGKVRTLGSRSRSSDSSEGEFPRKGGKEGHQGGLQAISKGMQGASALPSTQKRGNAAQRPSCILTRSLFPL